MSLEAVGSYMAELLPLSPNQNLITNANAISADGASLVSANEPAATAAVSFLLSTDGSRFQYKRQATAIDILRFSMGHTADASAKTAVIRICGWRPRSVNGAVQWRGIFLLSATLTGGTQADTNSLLCPASLYGTGIATSFNHVSGISITVDKTYQQNAKVVADAANGIAELFFDPGSCPIITVEGSVGVSASCFTGEYSQT